MQLENLRSIEKATKSGRRESFRIGVAMLFIVGIMMFVGARSDGLIGIDHIMLVIAAMIGGYMALNIGANDVANNMGPAVGSHALTMVGAIVIAAIFEAAGALIAGGDVVSTIKDGIIDPAQIVDRNTFVWLMTAALLAGALWLNIATAMGAPVSTTHSIVGGVLGAGVAAGGMDVANWGKMSQIAASWVISPVLGGLIAAGFLYLIKRTITYQADMLAAARRVVPYLVAFMVWAFSTYLMLKGLKAVVKLSFLSATLISAGIAAAVFVVVKPVLARAAASMSNDKNSINNMFNLPLIFAAALLSFAHGANDVANAVGPLAAINDALAHNTIAGKAAIPLWVMMVGALGIVIGLALYGPKLIKTVGSEITDLDKMRAFCIAMAAAVTVIVASQLGLPVSSTHIAVGGVFGVGFLRELLKANYAKITDEIEMHHVGADKEEVEAFLDRFEQVSFVEKGIMLKEMKKKSLPTTITTQERKSLKKVYRSELVKRSAVVRIAAAWIITVPVSALLAAMLFFMIRGIMVPV